MEQKFVVLLIVISFFLTNVVAYLDEGLRDFDYLRHLGDWITLIIYSIVFLVIPLLLFFGVRKNHKHRLALSLFGFAPTVMLILLQLS